METYALIRKRYSEGKSIRKIAEELGISRHTVKKYCDGSSQPGARKTPVRQATSMTEEIVDFIRQCLEEDAKENLKKQRHTARRIFSRLVTEKNFTGGESTVRHKVRALKAAMPRVFIPLQFGPGEAMQVDWGVASAYINGVREEVNLFCARLCYSCKPVVLAYRRQNEESFLEAFVTIFTRLGGVPKKVIFDNARVAVKEGFGIHAVKQAGYSMLSAHYAFEAVFCNPGEGHEKGLVEGLVGLARRRMMVPLPRVENLAELNVMLAEQCEAYGKQSIRSRPDTVEAMFETEKCMLTPLPKHPFDAARCINARVDAFSTVRFQNNHYSVPVEHAGRQVGIKAHPETVAIYYQGEEIAHHARLFGSHQKSLRLSDYLPLLETRWRAALDAAPVKQNLSAEAFEELKANYGNREKMNEILRREAGLPPHKTPGDESPQAEIPINDPVTVRTVDLHPYDTLLAG